MPRNTRGTQDARRRTLRLLLRRRRVHTQEELVAALQERGFAITQSSLSRDLMTVGARKVDGAYRIVSDGETPDETGQKYPTLTELQPFVRALRPAGPNLLGEITISERVPFAEGARTGVEVFGVLVIAQSEIGMEGMLLNEIGIVALSAGLHGGDCIAGR